MFKVGAFATIFNDKKEVLLCHRRDYDLWNLPGGKVEKEESPWEGVIREIKEETGLAAKIDRITGIYYKPEKDEIVFNFLCSITSGEITLNDEADEIKFFVFDDIPENFSQKQKERIADVLENKKEVIFGTQVGPGSIDLINKK